MLNNIQTENIKPVAKARIQEFIERLKKYPEVEAIVCLGGLADTEYRDFIDKYSDIDISVFLNCDRDNLPDWLPTFSFYIPMELTNGKTEMMEVNLYQQILAEEEKSEWEDSKKEAYAYSSEVVFDRNGRVEALIKEKGQMTPEYRKLLLAHLFARIDWNVIKNPLREMERGYIFDGHTLLNQGMENLIELAYTYNGRYKPHPKWAIAMTDTLPQLPENFTDRFLEAMKVEEISAKDIYRRRKAILELVQEIEQEVKKENIFEPDVDYDDYFDYESANWPNDRQIKTHTKSDEILQHSKFNKLTRDEKRVLRGLISEYFITDITQIDGVLHQTEQDSYKNIVKKIQEINSLDIDDNEISR